MSQNQMKESRGLLLETTSFPSPNLIKANQRLRHTGGFRNQICERERAEQVIFQQPSMNGDVNSVDPRLNKRTTRRNVCELSKQNTAQLFPAEKPWLLRYHGR